MIPVKKRSSGEFAASMLETAHEMLESADKQDREASSRLLAQTSKKCPSGRKRAFCKAFRRLDLQKIQQSVRKVGSGRKKGLFKVSTKDIVDGLQPLSTESNRFWGSA